MKQELTDTYRVSKTVEKVNASLEKEAKYILSCYEKSKNIQIAIARASNHLRPAVKTYFHPHTLEPYETLYYEKKKEGGPYRCSLPERLLNAEPKSRRTEQKSEQRLAWEAEFKRVFKNSTLELAELKKLESELIDLAPIVQFTTRDGLTRYTRMKSKGNNAYANLQRNKIYKALEVLDNMSGDTLFLTLSYATKKFTISRADAIADAKKELLAFKAWLRRHYDCEFVDVYESTAKGYVHYHLALKILGRTFETYEGIRSTGETYKGVTDTAFFRLLQSHWRCGGLRLSVADSGTIAKYLTKYLAKGAEFNSKQDACITPKKETEHWKNRLTTLTSVGFHVRQFHVSSGIQRIMKEDKIVPDVEPISVPKVVLSAEDLVWIQFEKKNPQLGIASYILLAFMNNSHRGCRCDARMSFNRAQNLLKKEKLDQDVDESYEDWTVFRKSSYSFGCPGCIFSNYRRRICKILGRGPSYGFLELAEDVQFFQHSQSLWPEVPV